MVPEDTERIDWLVIFVIALGTFMSNLIASSVNMALATMMTVFAVGTDQVQWVLTAYMLTMGMVIPLAGYLGNRFGYKRIYCLAVALFTLGSLLCGMAWSLPSIIVGRVVQAIGGGLMQPTGMAMVYRSCPRQRIGQVMGIYGMAIIAAPAIGPTLGGYLIEVTSWKVLFLYNVPLGFLVFFFARRYLRETVCIKGEHLDVLGLITIVTGLFCLLLAISNANRYGWTSPYIMILIISAAVILGIMINNELNHPEPILDLRLLKDSTFSISLIVSATIYMGLFGGTFLMPLFLQNVDGQTALKAGLIMFPAALASAVMMPISGRIFDLWGTKIVVIPGLVLTVIGSYAMSKFAIGTSFGVITVWMAIRMAGMGLAMMPVNTSGLNSVPTVKVGQASSLNNVIRQTSAAFGVAIFTTIMQNRQVFHYTSLAESVNANSVEWYSLPAKLQYAASTSGYSSGYGNLLEVELLVKKISLLSLNYAINDCFVVATGICLAAVALSFLLREKEKPEIVNKPA